MNKKTSPDGSCGNPPLEAMVKAETPFGLVVMRKNFICTSCGNDDIARVQTHHLAQVADETMTGDFICNTIAEKCGWIIKEIHRPGKKAFKYLLCPQCILRDIEGCERRLKGA